MRAKKRKPINRSKKASPKRKVAERHFISSVLSSLPCLVCYMDPDLNYLYVNEAYERWFDVTKEQCLKSNMRDIIGEAGVAKLRKYLDAALSGTPQDFIADVPYKFGGLRTVHLKYTPDFGKNNEVRGVIVMADDISAERTAADTLKNTKEELGVIASEIPMGLLVLDEHFRILRSNPAYQKMLEYSEEELVGKSIVDLTHPDDIESTNAKVDHLSKQSPEFKRFDKRYITKSGRVIWVRITSRRLKYSDGVSKYVSIIEDVTEPKLNQIEIDTIFETMTEGLVIQNQFGVIEKHNPEALKILGFTTDQLYGRSSTDGKWNAIKEDGSLFPGEEHPAMVALKTNKPVRGQIMGLNLPSGERRWIKINAVPFQSVSGLKVVCTFGEVTEIFETQKELLEAQETAKIGSWHYDLRTGRQTWSPEHYRIFEIDGPQPDDMLNKFYRERIHPDDRPNLDRVIQRALEYGEDFTYDHRVYLDDGKRIKYVRGVGRVTKDSKGNNLSISGTCQDLTEIVELQEQNKFILKSLGIGIWKFNPASKEVTWDPSLFDLYDVDPKATPEYEVWRKSLSADSRAETERELALALEGKKEFDTTFEVTTPKGRQKFVGAKGVVVRNAQSEPVMMYGINWDKTQEHKALRELENSKHLLQSILDASPSSIFIKDLEGRYLACNQAFRKLFLRGAVDPIGKTAFDLFPKEVAQQFTTSDKSMLVTGRSKIFEQQIMVGNSPRWHLVALFPVNDLDGTPTGLCGMVTDIQDHKDEQAKYEHDLSLERAKSVQNAKLASLGELSAGIAHEINNPLALIKGTIPLLRKFKDDQAKLDSKLNLLMRSTERIEKIISGLKKFARVSGGEVRTTEYLKKIIMDSLILIEAKAKRHYTPIETNIDPHLFILCDPTEIEQVIVNLLNNSIDAVSENQERWIKIIAFANGAEVVLQIVDSGPMISNEIEQKLFQPFFTTKGVGVGTGLGLSIVKGILDNHKATIKLNRSFSTTCFELRFPIAKPDTGRAA